ncbi:MAG: hypothetical protein LC135_01950 [Phycisphaerae bacterium]|nr:hypothetical protein [Phycisphaerae bacterium]MCZ2398617.1 hypothetical protein [Phycisphaerae bacterium]
MTTAQSRMLHVLARQRGLTHDDLRAAAGVQSLTLLGDDDAWRLIERLKGADPRPDAHSRRRRIRGARSLRAGELRLAGDATTAQRRTVARLLGLAGWPPEKAAGWLWRRHQVRDLEREPIPSATLRSAIVQLESILDKHAPEWRGPIGGTT